MNLEKMIIGAYFFMYEKSAEEMDKIIKENGDFDSKYSIEEILSSKGRIIILKTLAEKEELNISAIARVANLNHSTTTQHLKFLTSAGLIQEKTFGRIKIFRFCIENYRAKSLKRLFEIWK